MYIPNIVSYPLTAICDNIKNNDCILHPSNHLVIILSPHCCYVYSCAVGYVGKNLGHLHLLG